MRDFDPADAVARVHQRLRFFDSQLIAQAHQHLDRVTPVTGMTIQTHRHLCDLIVAGHHDALITSVLGLTVLETTRVLDELIAAALKA